jgi:preprotein translocase YajC subunit
MQTAELSFVVILAVMAAFYFIFIRPARQEQKLLEHTIRDLNIGDEVITTAGFFARVKDIETPEQGPVQITLDFGNGIEIRALTSSIAKRMTAAGEPAGEREREEAKT